MEDVLSNCHTMLDIGANIGWYSAYFAHRYPQLQIHAFEPMPETFTWLTKNIAANHLSSQVTLHNFGLSDSTGPVKFHCYSTGGTNASLKNVSEAPEAVTVSSFTKVLDEWSQENSVVPDFIKCDVEGAELLVFLGGEATLRKHTPVVFTELLRKWSKPFGYHPNDVLHFFSELGYLALAVNSEGVRKIAIVDNSTLETNYLFLHEINHATLLTTLLEA
jgi:FkbM family methyltransferase